MDLLSIDQQIFQLINHSWANSSIDFIFLTLRNKYFWLPFYLFLISFFALNFGQRGWVIIIGLVLTIGLADAVSTRLMKRNIKRIRPCQEEVMQDKIRTLVKCRGYSFTSNHATNHMAIAVFLLLILGRRFPKVRLPLLLWVFAISYAQIYVGLHYPTDIIGGWILGSIIGVLGVEWTKWTLKRYFNTTFSL